MASTKAATAIWDGVTLTAGAADTTSSAVDLTDSYGAYLCMKITDGPTGPSQAAQIQPQISADSSEWYDFGSAFAGPTGNNEVSSTTVEVPVGISYLRLVGGSNTGEDVTVDADISAVTQLAGSAVMQ